ncbi:MAG: GDP-mannose 4,6-dehydratase [Gammaproteobacteria bacterium]|jgi:UDP-glucose 4-epimerase
MTSFLVTGAMGFIGSHWSERLVKQGHRVYGIDLAVKVPELLDYDNFHFVEGSITDFDLMQTLIDKTDCVCHFAGVAEPLSYVKSPRRVVGITALAGLRLVDMVRRRNKLFFYSSTSEVYGKNLRMPLHEDHDRVLGTVNINRWCYSTSKAVVEHYLIGCAAEGELDFITVRLFNVYGHRLTGRVFSNFYQAAKHGKDLIILGDGRQTRCFTYIDDVLDAFGSLVADPACRNEIYNVGNNTETSIHNLAATITHELDSSSNIVFRDPRDYYGASYEDILQRVPDVSKIKQATGWEATTSLKEGICKLIQTDPDGYRRTFGTIPDMLNHE